MKIETGVCLISNNGKYYRVIECKDNIISMVKVNGYTVFSCNISFAEKFFQFAEKSEIA